MQPAGIAENLEQSRLYVNYLIMKSNIYRTLAANKFIPVSAVLTCLVVLCSSGVNELFENRANPILPVPAFEDISLHRIQLRITMANVEDAGTDDDVYVQMNRSDKIFYFDRGKNDFKRGGNETFDFLSTSVRKIKDIQFLKVGIKGTDAVCIKKIELLLNDNRNVVYVKEFSGVGKWFDNSTSITIGGPELRSFAGWQNTTQNGTLSNQPTQISATAIVRLVEAAIGNQINHSDGDVSWGSKDGINTLFGSAAVEVKVLNKNTLRFDLDLQKNLTGPNPEIDVDFDLVFKCENGVIKASVENTKTTTNWVGDLQKWIREWGAKMIGTAIATKSGPAGGVAGGLLSEFLAFNTNFTPGDQSVSARCSRIKVTREGDILLK